MDARVKTSNSRHQTFNTLVQGLHAVGLLFAAACGLWACTPAPLPTPTPTATATQAPVAEAPPQVAWQYAASAMLTARVTAGEGLVLVAPKDQALVALRAEDGAEQWRYTGRVHAASLLIHAGVIFAGAPGGKVLALAADTGAVRWEISITGDLVQPPFLAQGILYLGTAFVGKGLTPQPAGQGWVYALEADSGRTVWAKATECYLLATPRLNADRLVVGGSFLGPPVDEGGHLRLMALSASDGQLLWQRDSEDGLLKSLWLDEARLYYLAYSDVVFALEQQTGALLWTYDTENWSPGMTLADGVLYFGSDNAFVHAVAGADGTRRWRTPLTGTFNAPRGAPWVADGRVYFQSNDESLYALDQRTGAVIWQTPPQARSRVNLTLAEGRLYLAGVDEVVYAYVIAP